MMSAACVAGPHAATASDIALALPMKCALGSTCFFQNYVDHDASANARDYRCGGRTYDRHDGTDIRIPSASIAGDGVEVLSAAPGRVLGTRNDMTDISFRVGGKAAVAGKECGNGAVIEHEGGWQTQYCHLAKDSVRVRSGDRVATGQVIGRVGLSGETEFFHLHFTVRHDGKIVDPFAYEATPNVCGGGRSLWADPVRAQTEYRTGDVIDFGFTDTAPTMDLLESGGLPQRAAGPTSEILVAYIRAIGLEEGDQQTLRVVDPRGNVFAEYTPPALDHDKAQYLMSAGRKLRENRWPGGTYVATYSVVRKGAEVLHKTFDARVD